jgi:hypothetical protein
MTTLTAKKQKELADAFACAKSGPATARQNSPFPKPTLRQAVNDVLDPWLAEPSGVEVDVSFDSMLTSDLIALSFNDDETFEPLNGSAFKKVTFTVPAAAIAASVGKTVPVMYAVIRPVGTTVSDTLNLQVTPIAQTHLPTPAITQAAGSVLDLTTFTGVANLVVGKWPLAVVGQRVWLTVSGPGGVPTYKLLEGYPINAQEVGAGIARDIPRAELDKFVDGNLLTVTCKVTFDGSNTEASTIAFHIVTYTIKKLDDSVLPTITSVTDSKGNVANGGTTFDTSVTLAGKASPSQQVQILDGGTTKGNASVNTNGDWTLVLTALSVASHNITAKALYGSNPVSAARTFTVATAVTPTITRVNDSKGNVANGGTTFDTSVTVVGQATPSQQVQILDGTTFKGNASVYTNGEWALVLTALSVASHNITAKALYGSNPVSNRWSFTVQAPIPPLTIDTSTLTLSGTIVRWTREPTTPPGGSFARRTATGGTPPYTYTVANSNIVDINAATGQVISLHSGQTTVTARDSGGQSVSYPVVVSNVRHIDGWNGFNTYRVCTSNAAGAGGVIPSVAEWNAFRATYGGTPNIPGTGANQPAWSRDSAGGNKIYCIVPNSGATSTQPNVAIISGTVGGSNGWAIINR